MEQLFNFKIRNEKSISEKEKNIAESHLRNIGPRKAIEKEKESISLQEQFGEDIFEKMETVKDWIHEELKKRGVDTSKLIDVPVLLMKHDHNQESLKQGYSSAAGDSYIRTGVGLYEHNDDMDTKQMSFLKIFAHELYHTTYTKSSDAVFEGDNFDSIYKGNIGAGYVKRNKAGETIARGNMLEEGMAMDMELKIFEKTKTLFPKESVDRYREKVDEARINKESFIPASKAAYLIKQNPREYERELSTPFFSLSKNKEAKYAVSSKTRGYEDSYDVLNFIK